jgi:hypothetical protein
MEVGLSTVTARHGGIFCQRIQASSDLILSESLVCTAAQFSNLNLINPPNWFHFVANSSDLIFDDMHLTAISNNTNPAANSGKLSPHEAMSILKADLLSSNRWLGSLQI